LNTSRTSQILRQRGIAIAAGGLALQLLFALTLLGSGLPGLITLLLLLGTAGTLATSYTTVSNKTELGIKLQGATVIGAAVCAFMGSTVFAFIFVLIGAVVTYVGAKQLAAGLGR
jgi:hypothetical protein